MTVPKTIYIYIYIHIYIYARLDISKPPALYTVTYCNTLICMGASTKFCVLTSTKRQLLNPIYQKGQKFFYFSALLGFYSA